MTEFKPMLADKLDLKKLEQQVVFPTLISPKYDGYRCFVRDGVGFTRSLKKVRNRFVQSVFNSDDVFHNLDGELIVGDPTDPMVFRNTSSGVASFDGEPDFALYVFDWIEDVNMPFSDRHAQFRDREHERIVIVPQILVYNMEELAEISERHMVEGYEGSMLRDPEGIYKTGRSTVRERMLLKIKPTERSEAKIIGWKEEMHNANTATTNELGNTARSGHQENMIPKGTLGAWIVENKEFGEFSVGSGMTADERHKFWQEKESYVGKTVSFEFQRLGGYDKPRQAIYKGIRDEADMGE